MQLAHAQLAVVEEKTMSLYPHGKFEIVPPTYQSSGPPKPPASELLSTAVPARTTQVGRCYTSHFGEASKPVNPYIHTYIHVHTYTHTL